MGKSMIKPTSSTPTVPERIISVRDLGPSDIDIRLREGGGITVLKGSNGVGKSTALKAARRALGAKVKVPVRDAAARGTIDTGTLHISISSRSTQSGEVEIQSIEGNFDLSALVDPEIDDQARADAARIKELLRLRKVEPTPALFAGVVGSWEDLEKHCKPETLKVTDIVEMAAKIKRDLDTAARTEEAAAEHAKGHAKGLTDQAEDLNLDAPCDAVELREAHERTIERRAALQENARDAASSLDRVAAAQRDLEAARAKAADTPSIDDLQIDLDAIVLEKANCDLKCQELVDQIKALQTTLDAGIKLSEKLAADRELASAKLIAARNHHEMLAGWQRTIDAGAVPGPSPEELAAADKAVQDASAAIEYGATVRAAKKALEDAKEYRAAATKHAATAERLRSSGKQVDDVLAQQLNAPPLRVKAGRLVLTTDRGDEYFSDLSEGERYILAIDLAMGTLPPWGCLVLDQAAYEGLSPDARNQIHAHAKKHQIHILAAEVSRGPLRCEDYEPDDTPAESTDSAS